LSAVEARLLDALPLHPAARDARPRRRRQGLGDPRAGNLSEPYRDPLMELFGSQDLHGNATGPPSSGHPIRPPRHRHSRRVPSPTGNLPQVVTYTRPGTQPGCGGRCSSVHALWRHPISSVSIWTGKVNGRPMYMPIYISWGAAGVHHCAGHDLHRSGSTLRWPSSSTPPRGDTRGEGVPDDQPIDGHRQPGPGTAAPPVPGADPAA